MQTMNALQKYIKGDKHFLKFFVGVKYSFAGNKHCLQEMSGKEKDMLEKEAKEKVEKRSTELARFNNEVVDSLGIFHPLTRQ